MILSFRQTCLAVRSVGVFRALIAISEVWGKNRPAPYEGKSRDRTFICTIALQRQQAGQRLPVRNRVDWRGAAQHVGRGS